MYQKTSNRAEQEFKGNSLKSSKMKHVPKNIKRKYRTPEQEFKDNSLKCTNSKPCLAGTQSQIEHYMSRATVS